MLEVFMIKTSMGLMDEFTDYNSPRSKVTRLIDQRQIIQLRRGLFIDRTESEISLKAISGTLYGPSYVSFETALSYYQLIPEKVNNITCASFNKNKNKEYHTDIASFYYYHVPNAVYPLSLKQVNENGYYFIIASPEKAILDQLYKINRKEASFEEVLFSNLRIDQDLLFKLNKKEVKLLAPLYKRNICIEFNAWFQSEVSHA